MNISICITTFNEEKSIAKLLDSLLDQTLKASEVIIVDGGSTDKTVEIIRHYQKKDNRIKLLVEKCSRAKGRNIGIDIAKNEIIAVTDAGCVAHKDWLEKLIEPFKLPEVDPQHQKVGVGVDISAGFYRMTGRNPVSKAMAIFLGVLPSKFDINFLPSTRSMAFRKNVWEEIGGFPDESKNSAEDTYFNYSALKLGMKYARVKNALVEWGMPETVGQFMSKIKDYAKWDAKTKIFNFPKKGLMSHNIKSLSIFLRYIVLLALLVFSFATPYLFAYFLIFLFAYFIWSFRKVFLQFREVKIALWGPVLQVTSDFAVMAGFLAGILGR